MKLSDVCIRRPVFAVMLVGGLVVLGLVSIGRLGVDLWPKVEFPIVTVWTELHGAAPETIEREVSEVLEESVNTIEGIRSLRSQSSDSLSLLLIEFELEYDIEEKAQQVRERVAAVRGQLPEDAEPPVVGRVDPDASPILSILVSGPRSIKSLTEMADRRIKTRLERVPGVGSITILGGRKREVRVWIDALRLAGHGLTVDDVVGALRREHVDLPGGRIETGRLEYTVKTEGRLATPEAFGRVVVAERDGRVVHLRDVARVEDGLAEERTLSRLNGRRGVALLVRRQSGENTVAVASAVKQELTRIRAELPEGHELTAALDASTYIVSSIRDVGIALGVGAALASLVVLAFLRNLRATAIVAVAIPASIVSTFTFFYVLDFTINSMTLMALSLSIGLLIDDAIVVLENVYRHLERGKQPHRAASEATEEIGLAVVATTASICAVFVPIAFLSGVVGRFFREFGLVACCAVLLSTLVALTLTPMLCSRLLRVNAEHGRLWHAFERGYQRLERGYRRLLVAALDRRAAVMGLAALAVAGGVLLAGAVPKDFVIAEDRSEFNVWLKMPLGTPLAKTQEVAQRLEHEIIGLPRVRTVFTTVGSGSQKRVNEASIYVQLVPKSERPESQKQLMAEMRERIGALDLPLEDHAVEELGMLNVGSGRNADIMYSVRGPSLEQLRYYAGTIVERMRRSGGYADVYLSYEVGKPEVALEIARERAADLGVTALQIGSAISALYAGLDVTSFEEAGERYDVRVQLRPEDRDDPSELGLIRVRGAGGALVPLGNLVTPQTGSGPVQIDRENRTRVITIFGNLDGKAAGTADREIAGFVRDLELGGDYQFAAVGPSQRLRETATAVLFAFVLALVSIYMILAAQFDSFVHPFTIMVSAPLSFVGAFAALFVMRSSLDIMGQIAFLMLMGIVMKNGILLVDYTNTLRARGLDVRAAVLEAGPTRMRPVLMTAISTIFGMLPVALGAGDGSEWRNPMGMIAIGGLATSTLLTLLVVPVFYSLVSDGRAWLGQRWTSMRAAEG